MALTIWNTRNSIFQGLRFIQSQMWYVHSDKRILALTSKDNDCHEIRKRSTPGYLRE
jgi:hypothetical protein